ncbi:MAG TPA: RecX family transcriptional regulator [Thermoanaerobaculia bacterium]
MSESTPEERCYAAALRLLGYRFRSEAELRKRLAEKEHLPEAVDAALARLRTEGWIDDARFAKVLAEARSRKGIGPKRVSLELRRLGVGDDVAGEALRSADAEAAEGDLAALVRKRIRILGRSRGAGWTPDETDRKKLLAYLLRQGYEYGAAAAALAEELNERKD